MEKYTVCIVTPDIIGPVNNGGIGTACFYLAKVLVEGGHNVSVLFTGPLQNKTHSFWKNYYSEMDVSYFHLNEKNFANINIHADDFVKASHFVCEFLKEKMFDFVHFQDWMANALIPLQAKETTALFNSTLMTVTMHSSTQWQEEGMQVLSKNPLYDAKLKWAEEYCVKLADVLISPSEYMFKWSEMSKWDLPEKKQVLRNCFQSSNKINQGAFDATHLIFFGRLETRKGLEYFIDSINRIPEKVKKISFVGKHSLCSGINSLRYIRENLSSKISYKIYDRFDSFKALDFIKRSGGLVVVPSLVDNFPYTIIELLEGNIPFICSNAGGIPEMVSREHIFDVGDKQGLVNKVLSLKSAEILSGECYYDSASANKMWLDFHKKEAYFAKIRAKKNTPLVSICIPYFNYPEYLPLLLQSIIKNRYSNYEVIIVNDGSTAEKAQNFFNSMRERYAEFRFYEKENEGIGATRNYAATKALGKYIIFMDSDNLACPNMIEDFVFAIEKSKVGCVTCHFSAFNEKYLGDSPEKVLYRYIPLGASREIGLLENVFGDANFIISKATFNRVGGFGIEKDTSWEDWEFLAKLHLEGVSQKIIPKSLFWYRETAGGFSRNTNLYCNHQRIVRLYGKYHLPSIQKMMCNIIVPNYYLTKIESGKA